LETWGKGKTARPLWTSLRSDGGEGRRARRLAVDVLVEVVGDQAARASVAKVVRRLV
jgi:hypothetical protein